MKYIKFLVALTMIFYLPLTLKSQDSTSIHDLFYKKQQQSLSLLSGWSVGNLIYSPLATNNLFSPETTNEHFHQMNFSWNLLNVGIAGLGHIIVNKDRKKPWDMETLYDKKKKAEKSIIINKLIKFSFGYFFCYYNFCSSYNANRCLFWNRPASSSYHIYCKPRIRFFDSSSWYEFVFIRLSI